MIEKYLLNAETLPTIPTPHDCKIASFGEYNDHLVIEFGDDLNSHDSIRQIHPDAKTLKMRIHLTDDYDVYEWKLNISFARGEGYVLLNNQKFIKKTLSGNIEYLYHWVTHNGMIVQVYPLHVISLSCDSVELIWNE